MERQPLSCSSPGDNGPWILFIFDGTEIASAKETRVFRDLPEAHGEWV